MTKLQQLVESEGFADEFEFFEAYVIDSVCPGICKYCDYTTEVEPDQTSGWCEQCCKNSVVSGLILGGLI